MPPLYKKKKNKREYSVEKRFLGMNARDRGMQRVRKKQCAVSIALLLQSFTIGNAVLTQGCVLLALCALLSYVAVSRERAFSLPRRQRLNRRIEHWAHRLNECEQKFRFPFHHLRRLYEALLIPEWCRLENGSVYHGEEVFLLSLNRLAFPHRLVNMAQSDWGRDGTQTGRAFKFFIFHVYDTFCDLLFDNLPFWEPYFALFAKAIQRKMESYGLFFPPGLINVIALLLDATNRFSCRVGGGAVHGGQGAARMDPRFQEAFYNGWLHGHGLKYMSIETPLGVAADLYGAESMRHNDLYMLGDSRANQRVALVQLGKFYQFKMYGDGIFPTLSHLRVAWGATAVGNPRRQLEDTVMKKIREPVEWGYQLTTSQNGYVSWRLNNKVLCLCCVLLCVCYVCVCARGGEGRKRGRYI